MSIVAIRFSLVDFLFTSMLTEEEVTYAEKNFLSDLEKLEAEFNESNKSMDVPYKCMMPVCVPNMQHYYIRYPAWPRI